MKNLQNKYKKFIALCVTFIILFSFSESTFAQSENTSEKSEDKFEICALQKSGNDNERFVILFSGDGYTKNEQSKFLEEITSRCNALLATEPYRSLSDRINIYAVCVNSNQSGVSEKYGTTKDTYFGVLHYGNLVSFSQEGLKKAGELKNNIEQNYLDSGAKVRTMHILSNTPIRFGSSTGPMYSFSSLAQECSGGEALIHEISHSIGLLKDEYGKIYSGPNASTTNDASKVSWSNMINIEYITEIF